MIYRRKELEFVLKSAFNRTTVSLSEGQLKFGGDWYTNCTFRDVDYKHYSDLFRYVLQTDSEKIAVIDKNDGTENYVERSAIVKGLKAYFLSYGVRNQIFDTPQGRTRLLDILTTKILPVILLSESGYERYKTEAEDIEEKLLHAMEDVQQKPFSPSMALELIPYYRSTESYDPDYSEDECNYEVEIPISNAIKVEFWEYNEWLIREVACPLIYKKEKSVCDEVCRRHYIRSFNSNEMDNNPDAPVERKLSYCYSDYVLRLHLSTHEPDKSLIEGHIVKYKTKMDLYRLADYKGYSQHQIKNEIYKKGLKHIYEQITSREGEVTKYCNQLFLLMKDLLDRAFSLNMNQLISGEKIAKNGDSGRQLSIDDYNKELEKIVVNVSQVTSTIRSLHQEEREYAEQCYLVIQSILQSHIQMLHHIGANVSNDFVHLLDGELLDQHMREIKKYIKKLETLLIIQKTVKQEKPYLYKEPKIITDLYTYRDPRMLENYKATLKNYYESLKMEIKNRNAECASGEN